MGNCLALQNKVIRVMKADGKILEYQAPLRAHQVLSEFPGHAISDTLEVSRCLLPDTKLLSGHLYYLLPSPPPPSTFIDKMMSNLMLIPREETSVVRIKLVITKQELKEMLSKGGVSVDEKVFQLESRPGRDSFVTDDADGIERCKVWKPVLQSIPE